MHKVSKVWETHITPKKELDQILERKCQRVVPLINTTTAFGAFSCSNHSVSSPFHSWPKEVQSIFLMFSEVVARAKKELCGSRMSSRQVTTPSSTKKMIPTQTWNFEDEFSRVRVERKNFGYFFNMRVLKCILPRRPSAQQVQPLTKSLTIFMPEDYDYEAERESSRAKPRVGILRSCEYNGTRTDLHHSTLSKTQIPCFVFGRWTPDRDVYVLATLAHSSSSLRENHPRYRQHPVNVTVCHVSSSCLPFKPSERFVHLSINGQLQVMLKGKMCVAKRSFFSFWNNYVHVYGTITRQAKENEGGDPQRSTYRESILFQK